MNYFKNCTCIDEVKQTYKKLAFKHHPDKGGNIETMQEINNQYEIAFNRFKNIHKDKNGETYKKETTETYDQFKNIIEKIISFENVKIEIIGSWIWLTGETKPYKDIIKGLKFRWSRNKNAWYYHEGGYFKKSKKKLTLDNIREMYGSEEIKTTNRFKLQTA